MEQPGLRIEERVNLDREGMGQDQIREFDMFLGEYESLVMEERGPEARWALGQWLRQSQHGAGLQDAAESIIADRCQGRSRGAHVFPLRREPADPVLRARLLRWTNCLCGLMANIYERGMLESAPGLPVRQEEERPRSRSPRRRPDAQAAPREEPEERGEGARQDGEDSDISSFMDLGEHNEESGDADDGDDADDGGGEDGATPEVPTAAVLPASEERGEDVRGEDDVPAVPATADLPGAGIGPMSLDALDTTEERWEAAQEEGEEHARQCYLVETAVRNALHSATTGTAREVVRRLLLRQEKMNKIMYWLQRALSQALRTCPNVESEVDHGEAGRQTQRLWAKLLGEDADEPSIRLLSACLRDELDRRGERSRSPRRHDSSLSVRPDHELLVRPVLPERPDRDPARLPPLLYLRDLIMSIFGLMFLVLLGVTIGPSLRRPRGCVKYRGRNRHAYYHGGSVPVVPLVGLVVRDRCCLGRPQHKVEVEFPKLIGERVKDMVTMTMKMKKWRM
eukprot:s313_g3.t1